MYKYDVYSNAFIYLLKNPPKGAPADVDWFEIRAKKTGECGFQSLMIFSGKSVEITYLSGSMMSLIPYDDESELRFLDFEEDQYAINFANDLIRANKDEIDVRVMLLELLLIRRWNDCGLLRASIFVYMCTTQRNIERIPLDRIEKISKGFGATSLLIYEAVIVTRFLPDDTVRYHLRAAADDKTYAIFSAKQFTVERVLPTEIHMKPILSQRDEQIYALVFDSPAVSNIFFEKAQGFQNLRFAQDELLRKTKISDRRELDAAIERKQREKYKPLKIYDRKDKASDEESSLVEKEKNIEKYYTDDKGKGKAIVDEEYESKMKKLSSQFTSGG